MDIFRILLYTVIIIAAILLVYATIYNNIKTVLLRINSVENEIDMSLRSKYDLIIKIISILKQINDSDEFDEADKLKDENMTSFEFERKLLDIESKIYKFKNENSKVNKNTEFNDNWYLISNINSKIKADENYYNENTTIYNNLISKFPSRIIAVIMNLKEKRYFDGKDMYDKNTKDFKI